MYSLFVPTQYISDSPTYAQGQSHLICRNLSGLFSEYVDITDKHSKTPNFYRLLYLQVYHRSTPGANAKQKDGWERKEQKYRYKT